ncbi:MAG: hypothetical protein K6T85_08275 [Gorillibacterium sp.]|nr:hypothetical protein [Gorillibacterium sp.]
MPRHLHIISHTHWDREWYLTFQQFRLRLIDLVDHLLDLLDEDPAFKHFYLDGQMIILDDYLAVRPGQRERLEKHIRSGRIAIGPWYVQNDTFLTSAESTIRNLFYGLRDARKWTDQVMNVGYMPDQFGHISQLPQILRGFGIDNVILGRGYKPECHDGKSEFNWVSPDGSSVLTVFLAHWYNNAQRLPIDPEQCAQLLAMITAKCEEYATTEHLLLMNGVDHLEAQENLSEVLRQVKPQLPHDVQIHHTTPSAYLECIKAEQPILSEFVGELREGDQYHLLQGTLSARVYLKQLSMEVQDLLEKYVEPVSAWSAMHGLQEYPVDHMAFVWKMLMQNHPHDSICGCSRDAVHETMVSRFREAREVLQDLLDRGVQQFVKQIDRSGLSGYDQILVAYQTSSRSRSGMVDAEIDVLQENGEQAGIRLTDATGKEIPHQTLIKTKIGKRMLSPINLPTTIPVIRHQIRFLAEDIPAMGYSTYRVEVVIRPDSVEQQDTYQHAPILENEFLKAEILANGSIRLMDKISGHLYEGIHIFEDASDIGHSYVSHPVRNDTVLTTEHVEAITTCLSHTPLEQVYKIEIPWRLPLEVDEQTETRSATYRDYSIITEVRLAKNSRVLSFSTNVNNQVQDHRLRVLFPVPFEAGLCRAGGQLDVIERQHKTIWPRDRNTHPNWKFVDLSSDLGGIALLNKGLHDYEEIDQPYGIALTLLRSVRSISRRLPDATDEFGLEAGHQCPGEHRFEYGIYAHAGEKSNADIYLSAEEFSNPINCAVRPVTQEHWQTGRPWVQEPGIQGMFSRPDQTFDLPRLPFVGQFLRLSNAKMLVSAFKFAEDRRSIVLRLWNPEDYAINGSVSVSSVVQGAFSLNLLEERMQPIAMNGSQLELSLAPKQLCTVELELGH